MTATVEDKGIVERLRDGTIWKDGRYQGLAHIDEDATDNVMREAASLIERLTSERDEARAKLIGEKTSS